MSERLTVHDNKGNEVYDIVIEKDLTQGFDYRKITIEGKGL